MAGLMRTALLAAPLAASVLSVAACGPEPSDSGPGAVTQGEAQALDDAAEMLEQRRAAPRAPSAPTPTPTKDSAQ